MSKRTSPYDTNFRQHLIDNEIFPPDYEDSNGAIPEPYNLEEIRNMLTQPRPSVCSDTYKEFRKTHNRARDEDEIMEFVIPKIQDNTHYGGRRTQFRNLAPLTDGSLVSGNPDVYHGAYPKDLDPRVRQELGQYIRPTARADRPILPNFALAVKGPAGTEETANNQATYDGALGARSMQKLQSYGEGRPVYDNNAYTITSTYRGGMLDLYTSHPVQSDEDRVQYATNHLRGYALTGSPESYKKGVTAYKNASDFARDQRQAFIEKANKRFS